MNKEELIDKVVKEWSYKCEKGYPDLNNEQDLKVFEELFGFSLEDEIKESKKEFDYLRSEYREEVLSIAKKLGIPDENLRASSKTRAIFLTDMSRTEFFNKMKDLGFTKVSGNLARNTVGKEDSPLQIQHKPLSSQGTGSAGVLNEYSFNTLINQAIEEFGGSIRVVFKGKNGKTLEYRGVAKAEDASRKDTSDFAKADTLLLDEKGKKVIGISLKKSNAIRWESSKRRPIQGINIFEQFIKKVGKLSSEDEVGEFENVVLYPHPEIPNKYKLYSPIYDKVLSKVVVINTPTEINSEVVFGKYPDETIVIKETFEPGYSGASFRNGTLELKVEYLYEDISDIEDTDDLPVFAFSNHMGQAYGIEFRSFSKSLLYDGNKKLKGTSTEIDFNDLK